MINRYKEFARKMLSDGAGFSYEIARAYNYWLMKIIIPEYASTHDKREVLDKIDDYFKTTIIRDINRWSANKTIELSKRYKE